MGAEFVGTEDGLEGDDENGFIGMVRRRAMPPVIVGRLRGRLDQALARGAAAEGTPYLGLELVDGLRRAGFAGGWL